MKKVILFLLLATSIFGAQLKDGKYFVRENVVRGKKWRTVLEMEVIGNKIAKIDYDMETSKGVKLSESDDLQEMIDAAEGIDPYKEVPQQFLAKVEGTNTPKNVEVDMIAGATESTSKFNNMMAFLIEKAEAGKTGKFKGWFH